jgi:signal transduction histidine kinase
MTATELTHLFTPLYTTKPEGTGLGLYVVQESVKAQGGYDGRHQSPRGRHHLHHPATPDSGGGDLPNITQLVGVFTDFAPIRVSASIHPGEGMSAPPESTMLLPRYCSYFTSHRYVVYSPTKKGWSFG